MFLIYTKNKNKVLLFSYSEHKHYRHTEINTNSTLKKKIKSPSLYRSAYLYFFHHFNDLVACNDSKCCFVEFI